MGTGPRRSPLYDGAGAHPETYNSAKRRRHQNLGLVRLRRTIAGLLAAIPRHELYQLRAGDLAGRLVDALAGLGVLQLEAAGVDEENESNVKELDRSDEKLGPEAHQHGDTPLIDNPHARRRR